MRTNIVLNDELLREAAPYAKGRSKRALTAERTTTPWVVKLGHRVEIVRKP